MTCVCSVGLDMIAIPGDTTVEAIAGIIADEAAIGMINTKTTAVRVIPAIGKVGRRYPALWRPARRGACHAGQHPCRDGVRTSRRTYSRAHQLAQELVVHTPEETHMSTQDSKQDTLRIGVDVGSTTVKLLVLDPNDEIVFSVYRRHHSDVRATIVEIIDEALEAVGDGQATITITGSGGLLLANWLGVPFVQEVIANKTAIERIIPATDVAIELGGEDAKIIYFDGGIEQRMNGTCAGGTGAFIDQMAAPAATPTPPAWTSWPRSTTASTPSPRAAACLPRPTFSPCSTRAPSARTSPRRSFRPLSTRPSRALPAVSRIRGNVAFLGGPLHYLPQLRAALHRNARSSPTRRRSSRRNRTSLSRAVRRLPPRPTTIS